jgi:large subunit ribosomal protein L15
MQINQIKLSRPRKKKKFIGRGGKKGTYSGRGNKGQKARSGAHIDPLFEGGRSSLVDRMKKKRGFKSLKNKKKIIQISALEKKFKDGSEINEAALIKVGIVDTIDKGKIKILGKTTLKKKFTIAHEILISSQARESVEKAGGKIIKK